MRVKQLVLVVSCLLLASSSWAQSKDSWKVLLETSKGNIEVALFHKDAPKTVDNFLRYAKAGFYDGLIFHRVIKGFMIQTGGLMPNMEKRKPRATIVNEADNGKKNLRGTLAMARTRDPHSAAAQFFINTVNNPFLDHRSKSTKGWGYCVFGKVVDGMDVVERIEAVATGTKAGRQNVPLEPVLIHKVSVLPAASSLKNG